MARTNKPKDTAGDLEIIAAPLPAAQLTQFRRWLLESTDTDSAAAKRIGITRQILYTARRGKTLSRRSLFKILTFLKSLPAVTQ